MLPAPQPGASQPRTQAMMAAGNATRVTAVNFWRCVTGHLYRRVAAFVDDDRQRLGRPTESGIGAAVLPGGRRQAMPRLGDLTRDPRRRSTTPHPRWGRWRSSG